MTSTVLDFTRTLPGRCSSCGWHTETQGHDKGCGDGSEWAIFVAALKQAVRDDGTVHQRHMRPLIRGRIEPKHIGQIYKRAIKAGIIREIDRERSNDEAGGNTNKWEPVYALWSIA